MKPEIIQRNCDIVRSYLESGNLSEVGKRYDQDGARIGRIVTVMARIITNDLIRGSELASAGVQVSSHPYTQEKYPHLYKKVEGEPVFCMILSRQDLYAEKEFVLEKLQTIQDRLLREERLKRKLAS